MKNIFAIITVIIMFAGCITVQPCICPQQTLQLNTQEKYSGYQKLPYWRSNPSQSIFLPNWFDITSTSGINYNIDSMNRIYRYDTMNLTTGRIIKDTNNVLRFIGSGYIDDIPSRIRLDSMLKTIIY